MRLGFAKGCRCQFFVKLEFVLEGGNLHPERVAFDVFFQLLLQRDEVHLKGLLHGLVNRRVSFRQLEKFTKLSQMLAVIA